MTTKQKQYFQEVRSVESVLARLRPSERKHPNVRANMRLMFKKIKEHAGFSSAFWQTYLCTLCDQKFQLLVFVDDSNPDELVKRLMKAYENDELMKAMCSDCQDVSLQVFQRGVKGTEAAQLVKEIRAQEIKASKVAF